MHKERIGLSPDFFDEEYPKPTRPVISERSSSEDLNLTKCCLGLIVMQMRVAVCGGYMGRIFSPVLITCVALFFAMLAEPIDARTSKARQNNAVAQALYAAQATQRRVSILADERAQSLRRRVGQLEAQLATARREAGGAGRRADRLAAASRKNAREASAQAAESKRLKEEVDRISTELAQAQESFVQRLSEKDTQYRREIAAFRDAASDIASTPEGVEALERFNEGDWVGARDILEKLNAARDKAEDIVRAARYRSTAAFFREAHLQGKEDLNTVIARYEEVVRLDPGHYWDWAWLRYYYTTARRFADAVRASERARAVAEKPARAIILLAEEPFLRRSAGIVVDDEDQLTQIRKALSEIRREERSNPDDAETHGAHRYVLIALVRVHQRKKRWEKSAERLDDLGRLIASKKGSIIVPKEFEESEGLYNELQYFQASHDKDHESARGFIDHAIELARQRAIKYPQNLELAARRVKLLSYKLSHQLKLEQNDAVLVTFASLRELLPSLEQSFPNEGFVRRSVVDELLKTGRWTKISGPVKREMFLAAEQVARISFSKDPNEPHSLGQLSRSIEHLGNLEYRRGNLTKAKKYSDESIVLAKRYALLLNKRPDVQRFAWQVLRNRALVYGGDGQQFWDELVDMIEAWRRTPTGRESFTFSDRNVLYEAKRRGSRDSENNLAFDSEMNSHSDEVIDDDFGDF